MQQRGIIEVNVAEEKTMEHESVEEISSTGRKFEVNKNKEVAGDNQVEKGCSDRAIEIMSKFKKL